MKHFYTLLLLIMMVPAPVEAEETTLTWDNPVLNEDGTPLTDLAGIRLWMLVGETTDPTQTSYVISGLKPAEYMFIGTAYTTANPPVESKISNTATKTSSGWVVQNIFVRTVSKTPGRFLLLAVGTIPLGTACDVTQEVNGHYAVPLDAVVWSDPARNAGTASLPLVVVAQCG